MSDSGGLTELVLPHLMQDGGEFTVAGNPVLYRLHAPQLSTVGATPPPWVGAANGVDLHDNPQLGLVELSGLTHIAGDLQITDSSALSSCETGHPSVGGTIELPALCR